MHSQNSAGSVAQTAPLATHYPAFDLLRFLLASLVFWDHAGYFPGLHVGDFAVRTFFALSGWLIGGILLDTEARQLPQFFYNRLTRIWAPYLLAVVLLYLAALLKEGAAPYFFHSLIFDLTLTHNLFIEKVPTVLEQMPMQGTGAHFWSIAVEEQFYLMAPLLLIFTPLRRSWAAWGLLTGFAVFTESWYGSVALGVFAVMLMRRFGLWYLRPSGQLALLLGILVVGGLGAAGLIRYAFAAPLVAVSIVLLLARPGRRFAFGQWLGGISYPMYLNHWMGLFVTSLVTKVLLPGVPLVGALAGYAVAIAISGLAYALVDRQILAWRGRAYRPVFGHVSIALAYGLMALGLWLGSWGPGPILI